jgi:hypothetical protein
METLRPVTATCCRIVGYAEMRPTSPFRKWDDDAGGAHRRNLRPMRPL